MRNYIFVSLLTAMALVFVMPSETRANNSVEIIEQERQNIVISTNLSTLRVSGASGMALEIYNVAGVKLMNIKVDGDDKRYELNLPKGCYIVKISKVVRKIYIK